MKKFFKFSFSLRGTLPCEKAGMRDENRFSVAIGRFVPHPTLSRRERAIESGNIFLAIFGAVALVGVIGAGVMNFSKGPVQGALTVIRKNNAAVDMSMGGQMAIMTSVNKDTNADCAGLGNNRVTDSSTGNCYWFIYPDSNWSTANSACQSNGGYLATATSASERALMLSISNNSFWLSGSDAASEGVWKWTSGPETGQQFWQGAAAGSAYNGAYTSFASGEPNNSGGSENCLTDSAYGWNDIPCGDGRSTMCEKSAVKPGDCDSDGYVEPPEWRVAGGGVPKPTNGGLVPNSIGIPKKDPWGHDYGYCVWDHGPTALTSTCQSVSGTNKRLQGTDSKKYPVVAIISAGADGVFTTTCRNFATGADKADQDGDGNLEGAGDYPLVSKAATTDDDIIVTYTYDDAVSSSGGLWKLKSSDLSSAFLNKKIEALGATIAGTVSVDRLAAVAGDFIDMVSGIKLADPATLTNCNATNTGILRRAASGYGYEQCNGSGWASPGGGTSTNIDGFSDGVSYATNSVIAGLNAAPSATGSRTTALGISALGPLTTVSGDTALGYMAGASTGAFYLTAAGWKAGAKVSSYVTAIGYEANSNATSSTNTAVGYQAAKMSSGNGNTAFGAMAMLSATNSSNNSIMGTEAGKSFANTVGGKNTLIGYQSGLYPTTMTNNASIGAFTLQNGTSRNENVAVGANAMQGTAGSATADNNVAVGANSLKTISTGLRNTAIGNSAGSTATSGSDCVAVGTNANGPCADGSTGIGAYSLPSGTGARNTAIGFYAANALTSGTDNTVIGYKAMILAGTGSSYNTTAGYADLFYGGNIMRNTTAGIYAGHNNGNMDNTMIGNHNFGSGTAGIYNTAFGRATLYNIISPGNYNTAIGDGAMGSATSAPNNTAFGANAGAAGATAAVTDNVYFGVDAGKNNTTMASSVAVGYGSMTNMATAGGGIGDVAVGRLAMPDGSSSYNVCVGTYACPAPGNNNVAFGGYTLGGSGTANNVAIGRGALNLSTVGSSVAVGVNALTAATTATKSTAFGSNALTTNQTGTENTAFGSGTLKASTGNGNTGFGPSALQFATTASNNTGVSYFAFNSLTTGGDNNTAYGQLVLQSFTTGSNNSFMAGENTQTTLSNSTGMFANVSNGLTNATAFGRNVTASNTIGFGYSGATTTSINGQVAFTATSDKRIKKDIAPSDLGLDFILRLHPVSYRLIDGNGRLDYGFIAQEVETALEGRKTNMVTRRNDAMKTYRLRADDILAPAVRAVQEQQKELEALDSELEKLK